MVDISRRRFLRGDFSGSKTAARPPWALAEADFAGACTRCRACIDACPEHILAPDAEARPVVDFDRGACTFCGACVDTCLPRALVKREGEAPWPLKARIQESCLARANVVCRACGEACPVQAIRFRPVVMAAALPEVDAGLCTGCGACFAPCPSRAILIV
jgi:ferredoxin-type protein NapF